MSDEYMIKVKLIGHSVILLHLHFISAFTNFQNEKCTNEQILQSNNGFISVCIGS